MKVRITAIVSVLIAVLIISCQSEENLEFKRYYSSGAEVYLAHCQNCHGGKGEGLSALIPPLTDSVYLKNNRAALACFVKKGLKGPITVHGKEFSDAMPAGELSSMEIAQVLTYIGNSFGNKLNTISIDQVEADLDKCK